MYIYLECLGQSLPWRNWLARSAVNRKAGGSSPLGRETNIFLTKSALLAQSVEHQTFNLRVGGSSPP